MSKVIRDFAEMRRVSTPIVGVTSTDYRATIAAMCQVRMADEASPPPCVGWDLVRGHYPLNLEGKEACELLGAPDETEQAPAMLLKRAVALPGNAMLFMVVPDPEMCKQGSFCQAIANLRDVCKSDRVTLVLIGPGLSFLPVVAGDMAILDDPLPDDNELRDVIVRVRDGMKKSCPNLADLPPQCIERAVELCRGMTRFAAEEGVSRKMLPTTINHSSLSELQRQTVESSTGRALVFEKGKEKFEDIGGMDAFKSYMDRLFMGPRRPGLVVRIDEIDKVVTAASSGSVADNTGVAQDQLKVMLTSIEDNDWFGGMLVGGPGSGKTLSTICIGNTYGVRCLAADLGACRASLVGESERKVRQVMDTIRSIGGKDVLFLATCNRMDTLPPELQRRLSTVGTWFFDTPSATEREAIWRIQMKRFGVEPQAIPVDEGWVGSDIRNCCRTSYLTGSSLIEASQMITIAGKVSLPDIIKLRDLAARSGFLSASSPGQYSKTNFSTPQSRKISVGGLT